MNLKPYDRIHDGFDFVYKYFEYALIFKLNLYIIEIWVVVISMFFLIYFRKHIGVGYFHCFKWG
jgi:hypothetical protein